MGSLQASTVARFLLLILGVTLCFAGCSLGGKSKPVNRPKVDVGIFTGEGSFTPSVKACFAAVKTLNFTVDTLTEADLASGNFDRFGTLIIPAGDDHAYSSYLGPVGRGFIKQWVATGGGYIGFGGGGTLAMSDSIDWPGIGLIPGVAIWPVSQIVPWPYFNLTSLHIGTTPGPVRGLNSYMSLYYGGPEFYPTNAQDLYVPYLYDVTGGVAAVTARSGMGHVFVTGFQPEFEEGSMRDSTNFADNLTDPESEWDLIGEAIRYCIQR